MSKNNAAKSKRKKIKSQSKSQAKSRTKCKNKKKLQNNTNIRIIKTQFLNKLIDMYPYLERERENIIKECIDKQIEEGFKVFHPKYREPKQFTLLEKNDKLYFVDAHNGIFDDTAKLVGIKKDDDIFLFKDILDNMSHEMKKFQKYNIALQ